MITQHDALYRAICAEPDEDTPRLAFADLVEEEGDAARAAFIRTQIALARAAEYDPLYVSTKQLTPDAFHGWMMAHTLPKKVPSGCGWNNFEFRRGFPWKVRLRSFAAFFNDGSALFDAAPIQAFDVDPNERPNLVALAGSPHLTKIRRLEFSLGRFGANAITRLGDSPNASRLTELEFAFDSITAAGLEALAISDIFPSLESLELRTCVIPPALLVDSLGAANRPGRLGKLSLASNRITEADAGHLFALPVLHGLQELDLSDNERLGAEGVESLAASGALHGLRVLRLRNTRPGVPGVRALTESSSFASLRSLDLSENRLGPVAVKLLTESKARGLRVLNLANNPITDAGAIAMANSRAFSGLLELDLANTDLTDVGAMALAESPHLGNLLRLNLTQTARVFGDAARDALKERFGAHVSCS